jgi:hypothetical protein
LGGLIVNQELLKKIKDAYIQSLICLDNDDFDEYRLHLQEVSEFEKALKSIDLAFSDKMLEELKKSYKKEYDSQKNQ